jgi:hypothetical protein
MIKVHRFEHIYRSSAVAKGGIKALVGGMTKQIVKTWGTLSPIGSVKNDPPVSA